MPVKNKRNSLRVIKIKWSTLKNGIHGGPIMDRVSNDGMDRQSRSRSLKIIMEIGGSDTNFLAIIERKDGGVVGRDDKACEEVISKFKIVWTRESKKWK